MKKLLGFLNISSLLTINVNSVFACTNSAINSEQNNGQNEIIIPLKPNKHALESLNKSKDELDKVKVVTEIKVAEAQTEKDTAERQKTEAERKLQTAQTEKDTAERQKTEAEETLSRLQTQLDEKDEELGSLQTQLDEKDEELGSLQAQLIEQEAKVIIMTEALKGKNVVKSFWKDKENNYFYTIKDELYTLTRNNKKITKILNINYSESMTHKIDSNNNTYFIKNTSPRKELYVLKNNTTTITKINGLQNSVWHITIDNDDNVYIIDSTKRLYILNQGQETARHKNLNTIFKQTWGFDANNNFYFTNPNNELCVLIHGESTTRKIDNIGRNNPVGSIYFNNKKTYISTLHGVYVLKQNETRATKIDSLTFLPPNSIKYFSFNNDKNKIYIGCQTKTYILDFNHNIIRSLDFDSDHFQYDDKGNIYFGSREGLYKFKIDTMEFEKIKINNGGQLTDSSKKITNIYFMNNQIYFKELEQNPPRYYFYVVNTENIATKLSEHDIHWWM